MVIDISFNNEQLSPTHNRPKSSRFWGRLCSNICQFGHASYKQRTALANFPVHLDDQWCFHAMLYLLERTFMPILTLRSVANSWCLSCTCWSAWPSQSSNKSKWFVLEIQHLQFELWILHWACNDCWPVLLSTMLRIFPNNFVPDDPFRTTWVVMVPRCKNKASTIEPSSWANNTRDFSEAGFEPAAFCVPLPAPSTCLRFCPPSCSNCWCTRLLASRIFKLDWQTSNK